MKYSVGDGVTLLKPHIINEYIEVKLGAQGVVTKIIDLTEFYGENGKIYSVLWEEILETSTFENNIKAIA